MITYVNNVLVGNLGSSELWAPTNGHLEPETTDAGKFVVMTMDENGGMVVNDTKTPYLDAASAVDAKTMRIGIITSKTAPKRTANGTTNVPVIKWAEPIQKGAIKSYSSANYADDTEDICFIDFSNLDSDTLTEYAKGGKRIIVRLTFKDLPTRYRKWTESYEYVTKKGDTKPLIAAAIANMINKEYKRARVEAVVGAINTTQSDGIATTEAGKYFHTDINWGSASATTGAVVMLKAMKYDDDESVDSINWYNKVRFNVNVYWTNPDADGWESLNKNFPKDVVITKVPGKTYQGSAKLVRDREAQSFGYQGILNHGEGTWPIIAPAMNTVLTNRYKTITVEFENMYHTADDLVRKTKQALEIYAVANSNLKAVIDAFINADDVKLAGKLDTPAASSITDGHLAVWDKTGGVVSLEDGGANG